MMPVLLMDKYRTISATNSAVRVRKCYGKSVCIVQEVLAGNGSGLGAVAGDLQLLSTRQQSN